MEEIREYRDDDYIKVSKILKENFEVVKERNCSDCNVLEFVAVRNREVVGYFIIRKLIDIVKNIKWFYVEYVAVDKNYQNQGIGKEMMQFIINFAKKEEARYIELTSNYERRVAHHLYEEFDFVKRESNIFRRML